MPVTKSAAKAARQTTKRTLLNKQKILALKAEVKKFKKTKEPKSLPKIYSLVDKLVKRHILHRNKGARIKRQLNLLIAKTPESPKQSATKKSTKTKSKKKNQ